MTDIEMTVEQILEELAKRGWEFERLDYYNLAYTLSLQKYDENGMGGSAEYKTIGFSLKEPFLNAYSHLVETKS